MTQLKQVGKNQQHKHEMGFIQSTIQRYNYSTYAN